jgi:hypothetical protein
MTLEETHAAVGDEEQFKYLGIHGYDTFQADQKGVLRDGTSLWIKDACRKESDADYSRLTVFQRYVLDAMRRLRGLHGKNPANNLPYICRALAVLAPDKPHIRAALGLLVVRGLLVLTNEPVHFEGVSTVGNKGTKSSADASPAHQTKDKNSVEHPSCEPYRVNTGCPLCVDDRCNTPGFDIQTGADCVCIKVYTDSTKRHEITPEEFWLRRENWLADHR